MIVAKVITGGQTGADLAGWKAAKAAGIPTGGWMPKGFVNLDGPHPGYASLYGAKEHPSPDCPPRTQANVFLADAALWFGNPHSPGGRLTLRLCQHKAFIPRMVVIRGGEDATPEDVAGWIGDHLLGTRGRLLVAGNRETDPPRFGPWVEGFLADVFRMLRP